MLQALGGGGGWGGGGDGGYVKNVDNVYYR